MKCERTREDEKAPAKGAGRGTQFLSGMGGGRKEETRGCLLFNFARDVKWACKSSGDGERITGSLGRGSIVSLSTFNHSES